MIQEIFSSSELLHTRITAKYDICVLLLFGRALTLSCWAQMGQDFWAGPGNSRARWVVMLSVTSKFPSAGWRIREWLLRVPHVSQVSGGLKNVKMSPFGQKAALPSKDPLSTSGRQLIFKDKYRVGEKQGSPLPSQLLAARKWWQTRVWSLSGPLCLKTSSCLLHEHT